MHHLNIGEVGSVAACVSPLLLCGGQVLERCCSESSAGRKQDKRITGSSAIDQQLQKVCVFYSGGGSEVV